MKGCFHTIVIGGGVVGLSTAYHLARTGTSVLLLEQFGIPHNFGQSHGGSRAFSLAYDSVERIQLAFQARALVHRLGTETGLKIFFKTGGLDVVEEGPGSALIRKTREAMDFLGVAYEELGCTTLASKFPVWNLPESVSGLFSPFDGILDPVVMIEALLRRLRDFRVSLGVNEPVVDILSGGSKFEVVTSKGRYAAKKLVVACGAWTNKVLAPLGVILPIKCSQEQVVYFRPKANVDRFVTGVFPHWHHYRRPVVYGFPMFDEAGIKVGFHWDDPAPDSDCFFWEPRESVTARLRAYLRQYLPDAAGEAFEARVCHYDNTPDKEFIVDLLQDFPDVCVGAGFSGHGFNSAIAIGLALADLVLHGRTEVHIEKYRLQRFSQITT